MPTSAFTFPLYSEYGFLLGVQNLLLYTTELHWRLQAEPCYSLSKSTQFAVDIVPVAKFVPTIRFPKACWAPFWEPLPRPPNLALLRALWSLLVGI